MFEDMNHNHTTTEAALYQLHNDKKWEEHWNIFCNKWSISLRNPILNMLLMPLRN